MQYDVRNKLQPLAYASHTLNKAESNYSTTHLEALAVVWALRHFRDIIYGYQIHVRTDHAAVVELFNTKTLTGKLARWSLIVQDFKNLLERKESILLMRDFNCKEVSWEEYCRK